MNQDEIKTNLLDVDQWIRIVFMVLFGVAAWFILAGLLVVVVTQTLIMLVSGEPNRNLQRVGYLFGCYLQEIIQYLSYNSNTKPFPFNDFPDDDTNGASNAAPKNKNTEQAASTQSPAHEKDIGAAAKPDVHTAEKNNSSPENSDGYDEQDSTSR